MMAVVSSAGLMWALVFVFGLAFGYYETVYFAMAWISAIRGSRRSCSPSSWRSQHRHRRWSAHRGDLVDALGFRPMFAIFAAVHLLALP
jgi:hypothetical protein